MVWKMVAAFAAIYLVWGSTYLAIRVAVETMPPFLMAGARFLAAGIAMYWFVRLRGASKPTKEQWAATGIVGVLMLFGGNGGVVWAEQYATSGFVALVVTSVPLWVVAIDGFFPGGRKPTLGETAGLLLGFAGTAWLINPFEAERSVLMGSPLVGVVVLCAAFSWAAGSVLSKRLHGHPSPFLSTSMKMIAGGVALLIGGTVAGEWGRLDLSEISFSGWLSLAYLTLFGSIVAFTAYVWLLKNTSLARVSTYAYVNPVVAVFLGAWILGEPVTSRLGIGGAVVVSAVFLVVMSHPKEQKETTDQITVVDGKAIPIAPLEEKS